MSDEKLDARASATVPALGADNADEHGVDASQEQTAESSQEQEQAPATALTRAQVAEIIRGEFSSWLPQIDARLQSKLESVAQSASDKRFARLMQKLAPEIKGLDALVQHGKIDPHTAQALKQERFIEEATALAPADEPAPTDAQLPFVPPAHPLPVAAQDRAMTSRGSGEGLSPPRAAELLAQNDLTWDDVAMEVQQANGALSESQFIALVAKKVAARQIAAEKANWMKEYEEQTSAIRAADRQGAGKPPPGGASADPRSTLQKRYRNTGHVGDYLRHLP